MAYRYSDYENEKKNGANTSSSNSSYRYSDWQKEKRTELAPYSRQQAFQPSATGATANTQRLSSPLDAMPNMVNSGGSNLFSSAAAPVQQPTVAPNQTHAKSMLQQNNTTSNSIQNKLAQPLMVDPNNINPLFENFTPSVEPTLSRLEWINQQVENDRAKTADNKVMSTINSLLEPISKYGVHNIASLPFVSGFQKGAGNVLGVKAETAPVNGLAGKIGTGVGMIAGGVTNPTNLSQGLVSMPLKAGQSVAQSIANKAPVLGNRFAQRGIEGAVAGGIQGGIISGARGETDVAEMAKNIGLGAGLGALGDVAIAGVGSGLRSLGNVADNTASGLVSNKLSAINAIESAGNSVPTNRLKVKSNDEVLDQVLREIKPLVENRMAQGLPAYESAQVIASKIGYDLDSLLNNQTSFKKAAERLRMGGVAGAIDAPKNVKIAISNNIPETSSLTPTKESWFTKLFGDGGLGIAAGQGKSKELIDTHITKNAKTQVPTIERMKDAATVVNQDHIDRFAPLQNISKETYDSAMDSTRSNNLTNVSVKDKFVDLDGNVVGSSLKDIYSIVPRSSNDLAERYIIMRDAVDRMDRGLKVYGDEPWFPKNSLEAAQRVAQMEEQNPWLKQFGSEWNGYTANSKKLAVDSGLMSQQLSDILDQSNPNYAPMNRQMSGVKSRPFRSTTDSLSGQNHGVKRAVGGTQKIIEPAQSRINATSNLYNSALRNRAMQNIYEAISADPDRFQGIIEIVPTTDNAKQVTLKQINEAIERDGLDGLTDFLNSEADMLFTKGKQQSSRASDNFVTVMIAGEPHKMNVKELGLLRAIEGITPESLSGVLKAVDYLSRGVKISATGALAPVQGVKLFARDIPMAFAQSKDKLHFMQDISHALVSQVADWLPDFVPGVKNMSKLAREYYRAGGGYEQHLKGDSRIRATAADIKNNPIFSAANLKKQVRATGLGFRPLKELGDAFENIPRIAAFQSVMRKNGWNRSEAVVREALRDAREATVNWSRKGGKGQQIESLLPYSNAAVQGTYRMAKFMKEQPVSAMAFITGVAGATVGAYEKFKDDPDYKHRSKYAQGIPVHKTKDGKFITIPTEPAYQYIADQILNFYKWAKDNEELPNAGESIQEGLESLTPKYISGPAALLTTPGEENRWSTATSKTLGGSSLEPLVAASTGKNYFGGDIVPREYQGRSISEQKDATTSAAANWAAENLGMDAFTFDYIANKFGGDLAKVLLPMTSDVGKGDPTGNIVDETLARLKLLEDPVMSNNLSNEFYKYVDTVSRIKADGKEPPSWYENVYDNVTSTKKGSISKAISELNTEKKNIQRDITITAKQRSDKLRSVQTEINLLRIKGIEIMEQAGVK